MNTPFLYFDMPASRAERGLVRMENQAVTIAKGILANAGLSLAALGTVVITCDWC
jgi:hypothetical protein